MSDFIIFTDTGCDISSALLTKWNVTCLELTFRFTDEDKEYKNGEMTAVEFYDQMRKGRVAKTSAINVETFADAFEKALKDGKDILYLGFSSGLSNTSNAARLAAERLASEYPDRKILTVDTLCASAGEGMMVALAVKKKEAGATVEETAAYMEQIKMNICHWFTVDDLVYLKRGGRISPMAAFAGNLIGIKPVLHVDNEGHLVNTAKVRGRKTALAALASKYCETALEGDYPIYISHGDCMADVEELGRMIREKTGKEFDIITDVGPVIGAHAGPGVIALFFVGKER